MHSQVLVSEWLSIAWYMVEFYYSDNGFMRYYTPDFKLTWIMRFLKIINTFRQIMHTLLGKMSKELKNGIEMLVDPAGGQADFKLWMKQSK